MQRQRQGRRRVASQAGLDMRVSLDRYERRFTGLLADSRMRLAPPRLPQSMKRKLLETLVQKAARNQGERTLLVSSRLAGGRFVTRLAQSLLPLAPTKFCQSACDADSTALWIQSAWIQGTTHSLPSWPMQTGIAPLHVVAGSGHADSVVALLQDGADVNAQTDVRPSPVPRTRCCPHTDSLPLYFSLIPADVAFSLPPPPRLCHPAILLLCNPFVRVHDGCRAGSRRFTSLS